MTNQLIVEYPLRNNTVWLGRVYHSAMIGRPVAYINGEEVISECYSCQWEKDKTEYYARRAVWC